MQRRQFIVFVQAFPRLSLWIDIEHYATKKQALAAQYAGIPKCVTQLTLAEQIQGMREKLEAANQIANVVFRNRIGAAL